jgi:hypothetical protein
VKLNGILECGFLSKNSHRTSGAIPLFTAGLGWDRYSMPDLLVTAPLLLLSLRLLLLLLLPLTIDPWQPLNGSGNSGTSLDGVKVTPPS